MIETELRDTVQWLVLARPQAANALDAATQQALIAALDRAASDDSVAAVVLAASGNRAFCAGADLKEFTELPAARAALKRRELLLRTLDTLLDFPKPLLAAVQGAAVGAGAMLALACDQIVMAEDAWLSFPEITLGLPSPMGAAMAARRAAPHTVWRLIQHGARMGAREALPAGLADEIVARADLPRCCQSRAARGTASHGHAYAVNKRWINRSLRRDLTLAAAAATAAQAEAGGASPGRPCPPTAKP